MEDNNKNCKCHTTTVFTHYDTPQNVFTHYYDTPRKCLHPLLFQQAHSAHDYQGQQAADFTVLVWNKLWKMYVHPGPKHQPMFWNVSFYICVFAQEDCVKYWAGSVWKKRKKKKKETTADTGICYWPSMALPWYLLLTFNVIAPPPPSTSPSPHLSSSLFFSIPYVKQNLARALGTEHTFQIPYTSVSFCVPIHS